MVFSSVIFLFLFLPFVLLIHFLLKKDLRNLFLLVTSLFFYAWGEYELVLLMIASICANYLVGLAIEFGHNRSSKRIARTALLAGITINLSALLFYKYFQFIIDNLFAIGINLDLNLGEISLPLGISFFTFQNTSYLIDVYYKQVKSQKNLLHLGLYISLFPQLIAGPIVRYKDICLEIIDRKIDLKLFSEGAIRFIRGLAKKVIFANSFAIIADTAYNNPASDMTTMVAWLATGCYTLQIYFDFSGYSDMAIGLGKMLGFNFKENFNYPYIATSIQEFWRRWHISLSTWFRDYLYIPLGGNRKGVTRTHINLIIVFFITGLWHGASWNFIVWGLYHGLFLILERHIKINLPKSLHFLRHIYLLVVVLIGWVFFRADTLEYALTTLHKMFTWNWYGNNYALIFIDNYTLTIAFFGMLFTTPIRNYMYNLLPNRIGLQYDQSLKYVIYLLLFIYSAAELAGSTYNPFIYFRF